MHVLVYTCSLGWDRRKRASKGIGRRGAVSKRRNSLAEKGPIFSLAKADRRSSQVKDQPRRTIKKGSHALIREPSRSRTGSASTTWTTARLPPG